jgi:LacI family transcriptional regulator, galactose operon repressor
MATVKEVAKRAGVSVGTVSNVLTGVTPVSAGLRERVRSAVRELDYHPDYVARSLKLRHTMMLGMIISDVTNPFFSSLVRGAEDAALERNYLLLTFNTDDRIEREKRALAVLRSRRADGILLVVAPQAEDYDHVAETLALGTPVVCLDRVPPKLKVDSVTVNNVKAARDCVQHLIARGHRRIGIITGSMALQTARQRLRGYEKALADAGIPMSPELVREGDFRTPSGYALGRELLSMPHRPSAIFSSNGMMALGVLKAIEELGLNCPNDVALAVFDDLPMADIIRPHLTTVAQPAYHMGYRGAELLIRKISGQMTKDGKVNVSLEAELKIRESTAPNFRAARPRAV